MTTTDTELERGEVMPQKLASSLVKALGALSELPRDKTVATASYSYRYTELGSVLGYIRPILAKHDLVALQEATADGHEIAVRTIIVHSSGETISLGPLHLPAAGTAQGNGSAITYARRYALLAALGLATEDDDGATAQRQQEAKARAAPTTKARKQAGARARTRRHVAAVPDDPPSPTELEAHARRLVDEMDHERRELLKRAFRAEFEGMTRLDEVPPEDLPRVVEWIENFEPTAAQMAEGPA